MAQFENIKIAVGCFFDKNGWNASFNDETGKSSPIKIPIWHRDEFDPEQLYYNEDDIIAYRFTVETDGVLIYAEYPWPAKKRKRKQLLEVIDKLNQDNPGYNFVYDEKNSKSGFVQKILCTDAEVDIGMIDEGFKYVYDAVIDNSELIRGILI